MKAFSKLRDKLFPRSDVGISAVFNEQEKSAEPISPPALESSSPSGEAEADLGAGNLELTPELRDALFPKTRMMISATFNPSKPTETPPEPPRENGGSKIQGEKDFPIV